MRVSSAHLKLAVSIHAQPIFTTHLISSGENACADASELVVAFAACIGGEELTVEHDTVLSGSNTPLSRANCSRQMGRNMVKETTTKTSLFNGSVHSWSSD